jgi:hypothetical protein
MIAEIEKVGADNNSNVVRLFSVCLSTLVLVYSIFAIRQFFELGTLDPVTILMITLRALLGVAALIFMLYPTWLARPLEHQICQMACLFEAG